MKTARSSACRTAAGETFRAKSVVITTGTFLRGVMHRGEERTAGGRLGEAPAVALSDTLRGLGFPTLRLKTGTTPRIDKNSVDFAKTNPIESEPDTPPFWFLHDRVDVTEPAAVLADPHQRADQSDHRGQPAQVRHVRRLH